MYNDQMKNFGGRPHPYQRGGHPSIKIYKTSYSNAKKTVENRVATFDRLTYHSQNHQYALYTPYHKGWSSQNRTKFTITQLAFNIGPRLFNHNVVIRGVQTYGAIQIFVRPTLGKFHQKIGYNSAYIFDTTKILATNRSFCGWTIKLCKWNLWQTNPLP